MNEKETKAKTTPRAQIIIKPGDRINMLTVLEDLGTVNYRRMYKVKCDCGKVFTVRKDSLHGPKAMKSCGCDHNTKVKVGYKSNLLTVVEDLGVYSKTHNDKKRHWFRCKCECGGETILPSHVLLTGSIKSCGCLWSSRNLQLLNESVASQLRRARSLFRRTTEPRSTQFIGYGGRGIKCELGTRPIEVAENIARVPGYFKGAQLDRIDNNGNYTLWHNEHGYNAWVYHDPVLDKDFKAMGNLRWVTNEENSTNKITSHINTEEFYRDLTLRPMTKNSLYGMIGKKTPLEDNYTIVELDFIKKWYNKIDIDVADHYIFIHNSLKDSVDPKEAYNRIYKFFDDAIKALIEKEKEKEKEGKSAAKPSSYTEKFKSNKSGVTGVCWNERRGRWIGFISKNNYLKSKDFATFEEAVAWRKQQEMEGSTTIPEMEVKPQADGGRSANHLNDE